MGYIETAPPPILLELLNFITQGVLVAGPDRRILFCNAAFTEITGFSIEDVVDKTCHFLQGPETDPATIAQIAATLAEGQPFHGEILNYRKSGEAFWNDLTISPVPGADSGTSHFIGIQRDITARKQAEAQLQAVAGHQRRLTDQMLAGVVVHGPDGCIRYANATACRLLGVPPETVLGADLTDARWRFLRADGTAMPIGEFPVNQVIATGGAICNMVVGVRHGTGDSVNWLRCDAHPIPGENGCLGEVVVNFTDISNLVVAQQALAYSEERLRLVLLGSNDASFDWDIATGETYYSPRWWAFLGHAEQPGPVGQFWCDVVHPDDLAVVAARFQAAVEGKATTYELEYRLRHRDGHDVPVLSRGFIQRDAAGRAQRVAGTITNLTERKQAEEKIHRLAFYDPLTELPNRRLLMVHLQHALLASARSGRIGALLFIDLDNFKLLNDTLGHDKGDELLRLAAARLRGALRESDMVARLGGDEFVVMLEDLGASPKAAALQAELIGKKLLELCNRPYPLQSGQYRSTASVGVALFDPPATGVDEILKHADLAMYHAKAMGRNTLRFFDCSMQRVVEQRMALEEDLHDGLDRGEMVLHFQQQVDASGQIVGAEALVRWRHPRRGLILPGEFIPLAEQTGLILKLGKWVLRAACTTLRQWALHPRLARLQLSVNVSARQLFEPDFVAQTLALVAETGANPRRLALELTESVFAEDAATTIARMATLRQQGINFALDDFGIGYSSLSYLQKMPLDHLKIDKCFVADVPTSSHGATIVRIIITLAEKLGLTVVAEGVETEEQKNFLSDNGCTNYQGYLFGRPVPQADFEAQVLGEA